MVDQQEFHHAVARLAHHRRVGMHHHAVGHRHGAGGDRLRRRLLDLDQAHAAIAGDRQALVVAEARDFDAQLPRRPAARWCRSATSTSMPSMVSFAMRPTPPPAAPARAAALVLRRCARSITGRKCRIRPWIGQAAASPSAQIVWPSTWRVTCSSVSISSTSARPSHHALHHPPHPAGAFAARRALAAAFMLVELRQPRDRLDDVGRFVHHDHRRGAEARFHVAQAVEIHQHGVADRSSAAPAPTSRRE